MLTLGAIAELEDSLNVPGINDIGDRFAENPKASDILAFLTALARGGGHEDVTEDDFKDISFSEMTDVMSAISGVMSSAADEDDPSVGKRVKGVDRGVEIDPNDA